MKRLLVVVTLLILMLGMIPVAAQDDDALPEFPISLPEEVVEGREVSISVSACTLCATMDETNSPKSLGYN